MEHHFNLKAATLFGVEEAVLLHNIFFWIEKNKANKRHFYDNNYWTYNSLDAFAKLFPYWSKRQIERIINSLIKKGALVKGNYNTSSYDRTSWYAITETVKTIYTNGEMEETKPLNGNTESVTTIPYTNTNSNEDKKTNSSGETPAEQSPAVSFLSKSFKKWNKEEFSASIKAAREKRKAEPQKPNFTTEMLTAFFAYWSEPDAAGKMRFQKQDTWATANRLVTWEQRDKN